MIDLTPICQAVIALLAAIITTYLIPWIKGKTNAQQQEYIRAAIRIAVYGAEKLYGAGHGAEKFEYATQWLKAKGFDLDAGTLVMEIDAAIREMEQEDGWLIEDGEIDEPPAE